MIYLNVPLYERVHWPIVKNHYLANIIFEFTHLHYLRLLIVQITINNGFHVMHVCLLCKAFICAFFFVGTCIFFCCGFLCFVFLSVPCIVLWISIYMHKKNQCWPTLVTRWRLDVGASSSSVLAFSRTFLALFFFSLSAIIFLLFVVLRVTSSSSSISASLMSPVPSPNRSRSTSRRSASIAFLCHVDLFARLRASMSRTGQASSNCLKNSARWLA